MSMIDDLYQEMILDHNRRPRNFGAPGAADRFAEGYNPLCGDRVKVFVKVEDEVIKEIGFEGNGCAISTASASIMTEALKGKTIEEARQLFARFKRTLTEDAPDDFDELDSLAVFRGVKEYPIRVKCATLAWHTFVAVLEGQKETVSTEH